MRRWVMTAAAVACVASVSGCGSWEAEIEPYRERLIEAREAATPEDRESIDRTLAALDAARAKLREIESSPVRSVARTVAPFLPPPWNEVVVIGGGVLALILRAVALKRAARSIVASIEAAPHIPDEAFDADRRVLDAIQTPTARRIVDAVQGKHTVERYIPL